ncbi:MAG: GIY-YIG nuclease family protein [bacterium]|nr:GIY-YIG nuclease family protein [bacterium]
MNFFVYILRSIKDDKLYIGQTNNLEKRIERHNNGQVRSTKSRRPLELIYQETYKTRTETMAREKYLKSLKSSKYILENIIILKKPG